MYGLRVWTASMEYGLGCEPGYGVDWQCAISWRRMTHRGHSSIPSSSEPASLERLSSVQNPRNSFVYFVYPLPRNMRHSIIRTAPVFQTNLEGSCTGSQVRGFYPVRQNSLR